MPKVENPLLADVLGDLVHYVTNELNGHTARWDAVHLNIKYPDPRIRKLILELQMTKILLAEAQEENEWWRERERLRTLGRLERNVAREQQPAPDLSGHVYLIRSLTSPNYFKIGRTKDLKARMRKFEVVIPFEIELEHSIFCEDYHKGARYWHRHFADRRQDGEWFTLTDDDINEFKSINSM